MPKKIVSKKEKERILKMVRREFPGCSSLQEIHFYRYLKEIEQSEMRPEERVMDDRKRASIARKKLGLAK